eukprot:1191559-Prymnesium_polylepis.1
MRRFHGSPHADSGRGVRTWPIYGLSMDYGAPKGGPRALRGSEVPLARGARQLVAAARHGRSRRTAGLQRRCRGAVR